MVRKIVDIRVSAIRKQLDNIVEFVKSPKGLFETVDASIKTFREANRELVETLGVRIPGRMSRKIRR